VGVCERAESVSESVLEISKSDSPDNVAQVTLDFGSVLDLKPTMQQGFS
jgi:hypothetical protein